MTYDFKYLRPFPPKYLVYPPYSDINQYIEHYFFNYYKNNIEKFKDLDRQYLPIFWTTLYNDNVNIDVQSYLSALDQNKKYYTINQHDNGIRFKLPEDTLVFSASENGQGKIVPIPLLSSPIPDIGELVEKDIFCSFIGTITHTCRIKLYEKYSNNTKFYFSQFQYWSPYIQDSQFQEFKTITKRSKFSLCPRGNIIQSFRIYEVLQLGSIPVIIADNFTFPFKQFVDWNEFSVIVDMNSIDDLESILNSISTEQYLQMKNKATEVYNSYFTLEKMSDTILQLL